LFHQKIAIPPEPSKHIGLSSGVIILKLGWIESSGLTEVRPNPNDRHGNPINILETGCKKTGTLIHFRETGAG
jgi:hypothetical protein